MKTTAASRPIDLSSLVVASPEQVSTELAGEIVILDLRSGCYYALDAVGASVWNQLQQPRNVAAILASLLQEYDVSPQRCQADLLALLHDLERSQLIQVVANPAA